MTTAMMRRGRCYASFTTRLGIGHHICSLTHSPICSLTHSLTHSLPHSLDVEDSKQRVVKAKGDEREHGHQQVDGKAVGMGGEVATEPWGGERRK